MAIALTLHVLSVVIWVGGMFFAFMALRPVAAQLLDPPLRLQLWCNVFGRFFPWVTLAVGLILASGLWMIFGFYGGMGQSGIHIHIMLLLGLIMMAIYGHVYFAPFRGLKQAVEQKNWQEGGQKLGQIRKLIGINLILGLVVVAVATAGRYL